MLRKKNNIEHHDKKKRNHIGRFALPLLCFGLHCFALRCFALLCFAWHCAARFPLLCSAFPWPAMDGLGCPRLGMTGHGPSCLALPSHGWC